MKYTQDRKPIVLFVANEGGHYAELMQLKQIFPHYDSILVTDNIHVDKSNPSLHYIKAIEHIMGVANKRKQMKKMNISRIRRRHMITAYLSVVIDSIKIFNKYKPDVVISTGSNLAIGFFMYGWVRRTKLIYIESRAKVYSKSLTGKLVERFADKIFVQWPEMQKVYPNAEYCGTLL